MMNKEPSPHIPKYYGDSFYQKHQYFKMEWAEEGIDEYLRKPNRPGEEYRKKIEIFRQMLSAVQAVHARGYVHQDIKPENFRIQDGKVKILDFGLVMEYMKEDNGQTFHKPLGKYGFQGTPSFGSIWGLTGYTLNRRDDLESLGYSFLYLINVNAIPWA